MDQVRTFIAVEIPPVAQAVLAAVQEALRTVRGTRDSVKWVRPEIVHVTLKFLGDVPASRIEAVGDAVARACACVPTFTLYLSGVGAYPNTRRPRVVWVGLGGKLDVLAHLQHMVEQELAEQGFPPEERKFTPHLTLGRVRRGTDREVARALGEAVVGLRIEDSEPFLVEAVQVMRSDLRPSGPIYTPLRTVSLVREPSEPADPAPAPAPGQYASLRDRPFVAVIGSSVCGAGIAAQAEEVGRRLAEAGAVLVCGGMGGVMEAACRGVKSAGGLTVGILPGEDRNGGNPYVDVPIVTGMGSGRNIIVVSSAQAVIAVAGAYGTLSEIALARMRGLPVVGLGTWQLARDSRITDDVPVVDTPAEAVARVLELIRKT
jgi:2'-5' RNA ligase